ncbi:MAG: histidine--tRNA ligase [Bacilli bacterium]|nr:histidine--tRNA ligase [Bacilli bacterium]
MPIIAVKGTHDILGKESEAYTYIENVFRAVAALYGYQEFRVPVLEYTDVFQRSTGEGSDVARKEMYTFLDKGDRSVTLRPEFTAGIARSILENKLYATAEMPLKAFYYGPCFRYERPQLGRYRQFQQAGVECIGVDSPRYDAETILLAIQLLAMLGFSNLTLKVNSIGDDASRAAYREALQEYFGKHIDDMCADCHERIKLNPMRILDCKVPGDQEIAKGAPKMKDYLSKESEERFYKTLSILTDLEVDYEIDDNLVRGLDYYSEIVFEVHGKGPDGQDYGALLGGGHYDSLLSDLGGPKMSGVGFAFGEERIYSLMKDFNLLEGLNSGLDIYLMPVGEEVLDESFRLLSEIRSLGFTAESPLQAMKLGQMFKKATRRNAKFALIVGEEELEKGIAQLKNLATQEQKEISLEKLEEELDAAFADIDPEEHHHHQEEN